MTRRQKQNKSCFLLLFVAIIILIIAVGAMAVIYLPSLVEKKIGHQATDLPLRTKFSVAIQLFKDAEELKKPYLSGQNDVIFPIQSGESVEMICLRLEDMGLIGDAALVRSYLIFTGLDRQLQSGTFMLNPGMTPIEISDVITNFNTSVLQFVILPGWRIEEIAASLPTSGLDIPPEQFLEFAYNPPVIYLEMLSLPGNSSLEGYLFPGSYQLSRDTGLEALVSQLIERFTSNISGEMEQAFTFVGLTRHQAIILASIIQREGVIPEERSLIASVFLNRLAAGMRLETDPTIQYALGYQNANASWWKSPLFYEDLLVDSPYNTYAIIGLPPGPISNPDLDSIMAVAYPEQTPFYYFRARCDGSQRHNFSETYEEHLNNACE